MDYNLFIGKWVLDPTKNNYETSTAPKKGIYTISEIEKNTLKFDMEWISHEDNEMNVSYTSIVDGQKYPYDNTMIADYIMTKLLDENTLMTATYKNNVVNSKGTRTLNADGKEMIVLMQTYLGDGRVLSNKSVYNRG